MKGKAIRVTVTVGVFLSVLVALVLAAQDRYTVKVPNGLAFSEFRGGRSQSDRRGQRNESDLSESRDDESL
jgi:hypothetical protein